MKFLTIALMLILSSTNSFAANSMSVASARLTVLPFVTTLVPFGLTLQKAAVQINHDTQDYFQTGEMSVFLTEMTKGVRLNNSELSEEDSVSLLLEFANQYDH